MIARLVLSAVMLVAVAQLQAADSRTIRARTVELQTVADPQFGAITIRASASESGQIEKLSLSYQSKTVEVPPQGLRDLKDADIGTLHIMQAASDPAKPWLILALSSWDPAYVKQGRPASVQFTIDNGRVVHRSIMWSTDRGSYHDDKVL
jgi:hypothetical protein